MRSFLKLILFLVISFAAPFKSISIAQSPGAQLSIQEKEFVEAASAADIQKLKTLLSQNGDLAKRIARSQL